MPACLFQFLFFGYILSLNVPTGKNLQAPHMASTVATPRDLSNHATGKSLIKKENKKAKSANLWEASLWHNRLSTTYSYSICNYNSPVSIPKLGNSTPNSLVWGGINSFVPLVTFESTVSPPNITRLFDTYMHPEFLSICPSSELCF